MRHIFVVNPHSGPQNATAAVQKALSELPEKCELYVTSAPGDATRYVQSVCQSTQEDLRFYACGGDGTLNEVTNGAAGCPHAAVGCYPIGSGNDFVKYYGGKRPFLDLAAQLSAPCEWIDLIRVNDRYAINVVNIGFEAKAAARMVSFRRFPLFQGPRSYYPAVVVTLVDGLKNPFRLAVDGKPFFAGDILLCTMANGAYVGGSFRCAPRAVTNDGLLEVCMVTPLSRLRFGKLIGLYQRGEHLDAPQMKDDIHYCRGQRVEVESDREFMICLDGEILSGKRFTVECVPQALAFILPAGAAHTGKAVDMTAEKAV